MPKLNVLQVAPKFLPDMGGVELHVYQVARRLAAAGVQVTVLTTDGDGRYRAQDEIEGVRVIRVPAWPRSRDYLFAPAMVRIISENTWDLVHVQCYHTLVAPIAMWASQRAGIPYVMTFHGGGHSSWIRSHLRGLQLELLRPFLVGAKRLITVASFEANYYSKMLRLTQDRFVHIPNGCDLPVGDDATLDARRQGLWIASIGRLERYKGHHRALMAFPHILKKRPDARLWIIGDGPDRARLQSMASQLGVCDRVRIAGIPARDRYQMSSVIKSMDVVVLLSEFETQPVAALEALALGRPVLTTYCSGFCELADSGMVGSVDLRASPQRLADAIINRVGAVAPASLSLPSWDECAEKLLSEYQSLVRSAIQ